MACPSLRASGLSAALFVGLPLLVGCGPTHPEPARGEHPPVVAGLDADGLPALVRGRVLLGELGCVACHDAGARELEAAPGPDLATIGARVDAGWLVDYLKSPHDVAPGTRMPDLLRGLDGDALHAAAAELAAYLRAFAEAPAPTDEADPDAEAAARGGALFERIGCRLCHSDDANRRAWPRKYTHTALRDFLLAPHRSRPARRMPTFTLSPAEAHDLAHYLCTPADGSRRGARPPATAPAAADVDAGRARFAALGCASCHALPDDRRPADAAAAPLAALDPARGCLSGGPGAWPHYALTDGQRDDLRAALADTSQPDEQARVLQLLASRRCFVCHRRGDVDAVGRGLVQDRFGTDDASLGDEGRIPPPLTDVGAKLQPDWLLGAIAHGQLERPYLHVRMPGFGEAFAGRVAALLTAVDELEPVALEPLPEDRKQADALREIGRELVGDGAMNCITCHEFAGEQAGAMGAIDLVHTTGERLTPTWFAHYLLDPYRFKPNTLMPHFFPDGASTRPNIADGDVQKQIGAMWHYLAAGRNVRKPRGLSQPAIELAVGEEAVVLRRSVQGAGKRGISVGYPGGVNITFDAEHLGLNQLWWGRFVDARPVWTSQGSGQAHILERRVHQLPNGPALSPLPAPDAPWPGATRRERGDRWLGYDLDALRRPTFRYTCGDVVCEDHPEQVVDGDGATWLRRALRLTGPAATLTFLAARQERIEPVDERTWRVGGALLVRSPDAPGRVVTAAAEGAPELRLELTATPEGRTFHVEYRQQEDGR